MHSSVNRYFVEFETKFQNSTFEVFPNVQHSYLSYGLCPFCFKSEAFLIFKITIPDKKDISRKLEVTSHITL